MRRAGKRGEGGEGKRERWALGEVEMWRLEEKSNQEARWGKKQQGAVSCECKTELQKRGSHQLY